MKKLMSDMNTFKIDSYKPETKFRDILDKE